MNERAFLRYFLAVNEDVVALDLNRLSRAIRLRASEHHFWIGRELEDHYVAAFDLSRCILHNTLSPGMIVLAIAPVGTFTIR